MHIDKKKYKITDNNFYKRKTPKTQIILATSLRKDNYHITRLQHKEYGNTKKWNTFSVTRTGKIYQHYDSDYYSDFIGIKYADKQSISIVIENMGYLFKTFDDNYINWLNEICDKNKVKKKKYIYDYWEKFTVNQMKNVGILCNELCDKYNIPKKLINFPHYHKDISNFEGIVYRSNYDDDSNDYNPLFNKEIFNKNLF